MKRSAQRAARRRHLDWWSQQFAGLSLAEITADRISRACDALAAETYTKSPPIPDAVRRKVLELAEAGKTHTNIVAESGQSAVAVRRILKGNAALCHNGATNERVPPFAVSIGVARIVSR